MADLIGGKEENHSLRSGTRIPCELCHLACAHRDALVAVWRDSIVPGEDDPDLLRLVKVLVGAVAQLVRSGRISNAADLGVTLAAIFDLCVSLEYAELLTDTDWLYCPDGDSPALIYSYVKACPRCAASAKLIREVKSHKPGSDTIGRIAAKTIAIMLSVLSQDTNPRWRVRQVARRHFDVDILLFTGDALAVCEVKASPLTAFPLITSLRQPLRRQGRREERQLVEYHRSTDLIREKAGRVSLFVPQTGRTYDLGKAASPGYPLRTFTRQYAGNPDVVYEIVCAWSQMYNGYGRNWAGDGDGTLRWLTFGCGGGVDDSKNSPGIDRTDDIKKGIYQMLKLGDHFVSCCKAGAVRVALLSNVHAVRHHDDYLSGLEDVIWTRVGLLCETTDPQWRKVRVCDLIRLYDASINFTRPHFRDEQLGSAFQLAALLSRLERE